MLTDDQITELERVAALQWPKPHMVQFLAGQVPALLAERDLLVKVAEAAENLDRGAAPCYRYEHQETLKEALARDSESHGAAWISKETLAALLSERVLLLAVAEAVELVLCPSVESDLTLDERRYMLFAALAAWRTARDGVPAAGGAGKEQS